MLTNILLVEDNPGDRRLIQEALKEDGAHRFKLDWADRLASGLEKLSAHKPDAIILDLSLPDSRGLDTFSRVFARAPDVPVVVLTGLKDEELAVQAVGAGAQDYLLKSELAGVVLGRALRYAIERKRAEEELRKSHKDLELRVKERTAELRAANEHLQVELTERQQAEARYRTLVDLAPDAIVVHQGERVVYANAAALQLYGAASFGDLIGQNFIDRVAPDDREAVRARTRLVVGGGVSPLRETRILRLDGRPVHVEATAAKIYLQGKPAVQAIMRDITERKRAEEALRASEERFRVLSEAMPQIVWSADGTGAIDYVNQRGFDYGGVLLKDIPGGNWASVVHPDDVEGTVSVWRQAFATGEANALEHRLRRADGEFRWHLTHAVPVRNEKGKVIRWIGTATDIHDQKITEQELERRVAERTAELAKSMALLETATSNAPVVLFATDAQGVFTVHTGKAIPATGRHPGEIVGKHYEEVLSHDPHSQDHFRRALSGEEFPAAAKTPNGNSFETLYTPLRDADGRVTGMIGLSVDITERLQAEEAAKAERQRFIDVLDMLPAYVVLLAPDYHVPFANRFFRERFGESHGRCCFEYLFGCTEPCENCESFTVLKTHAPHHWEWTGPDGRNYDITDFPFTDTDSSTLILEMGIDITERKRAEESRRRSEERYRALVEATAQMVWTTNAIGEVEEDVPSWRAYTGQSFEEVRGWGWSQALHADDREATKAIWSHAVETRTLYETEYRVRRADGEYRHFAVRGVPVLESDGSIREWVGTCTDTTERKQAERELLRLNRALRTLSECNQAMVRARGESELLQEICRILVEAGGYRLAWVGYAGQDEAKTVRPVVWRGVAEGYLETLNLTWADTERGRGPTGTAIRTGQPAVCRNILEDPQFRPWREDAIQRGYSSSCALPIILGGEAIGALAVYSTAPHAFDAAETRLLSELALDIAFGLQALRTRAERERAIEALQRANAYNRSLLEASLDPLVTISPEGKITDVNLATESITGLSREELIGTDFSDYFTDPVKARAGYERVFREGRVRNYELAVQHRSGHVTPVLYNASVYSDPAGQVIGVFAAARDITERKRMEDELRQLSSRLLEAQDEERRRIARELHDGTSQNLAAVGLNLSVIQQSGKDRELARNCLAESISLIQQSLNEVRNISYLLHPPLLEEMGLTAALEHYVDGFRRRSGIRVSLAISPELGRLPKDAERTLFRVVQESLMNIFRHAQSPTARIAISRDSAGIVLEIKDCGRGMNVLPAQTAEATSAARPGVGIPGMRERLKVLGGQLEVRSSPRGTTIRATLPFPGGNHEQSSHPGR